MKWKTLCLLCLFCTLQAAAQYENIWIFGGAEEAEGAGLDFSNGAPVPIRSNMNGSKEACASICDKDGRLLFYTSGDTVWNSDHQVMINGEGLTGLPNYGGALCGSTTQGAIIVPFPNNPFKYYVFSLTSYELSYELDALYGRLYYSVVDMRLDGGRGGIEPTNKGILLDSLLTEKMTSIVGEHCNVWLVVKARYPSNKFRAWKITEDGIGSQPVESAGNYFSHYDLGYMVSSPNRKKLLVCNSTVVYGLELYDFNPETGRVSNPLLLDDFALSKFYGAEFSPDNSKMYVTAFPYLLYQYDLNALDIPASRLVVGSVGVSPLKLAPDGKIYFVSGFSTLGTISFPNERGAACGFNSEAIHLLEGTNVHIGLPNAVSVIPRDTFLTTQFVNAPCWANVFPPTLRAKADTIGWDYSWSTGSSGPLLEVDSPGLYWVSYRSPPCNYHVDTFRVAFPHGVLPDISIQEACNGLSNGRAWASTYRGDTVSYQYFWTNRAGDTLSSHDTLTEVSAGHYLLYIYTSRCDTVLSIFVPEEEHTVSFSADSVICQGERLQFSNTSDSSFSTFYWNFGDDGSSTLEEPDHVYNRNGSFNVRLIGIGDICTDTAFKTIVVDAPPIPEFEILPKTVCLGEPVYFYPRLDSTTAGLAWSLGEQIRVEADIQDDYQHAFDQAGTLPVTLTIHPRVCSDTSYTDSITVYPLPDVDLGPDSSICLNGQPVYLKNLRAAPLNPYQQVWSTGDTTETLKVVHPGVYTLSVSTEPLGCMTTQTITISKDCYVDIPNAFTPDGDGHNDYFFPRQLLSEGLSRFHMQVFNRWGQLLFETNRLDGRGWDGNFNGKVQPMGVYLYRIEAEFSNGRQEHYEGNVTVLR